MPSQPSLRPFDIAVALRLVLVPEDRYEPLAIALATSTSAVHRSVARLQHAGICGSGSRTIVDTSLHEFLVYGARYAFPAVHGPERVGLPTAGSHPELASVFGTDEPVRTLVWPMEGGTVRGEALVPLFNGVTKVAARDARLHKMLACVDALRVGNSRQRGSAGEFLQHMITARPQ
ncbi:MarR family transcriptional regulator [Gemmatimonas sp.]|uniref:MarR family transcriptional regulator n=1 Tax=Gemmatimonas sp. TaxID=1962908 RepID=UPI0031C707FF|nr:MarR family transcriptional regulator [Gemmatimonas sp.]